MGDWTDGPVALGHLKFNTTPESLLEKQPIVIREGHLVLIADARIDNREELMRSLGLEGSPTVPDPDLILASYERWADRCAEHLIGDFAFVLWDKARETLLCGRDHFGIKPLYYFHSPGRLFAFASEIKGLLTLDEMSDVIDELEIARQLVIPVHDDPRATAYRDARRALPGHTLSVGRNGLREQEYWKLDPHRSLELRSDGEYAEAVRETFLEAVRSRLRSTHDIACMLSGGIDSSSITCAAAQLLGESSPGRPLQTLSAVYDVASTSDEREYIQEVVRSYDIRSHFFSADTVDPLAAEKRLSWLIDGPCVANNLYINWNLYQTAAHLGNKVVLDGFDGDTTVSHGRGRLYELAHQRRWWTLLREVKAYAETTGTPWRPAVRSWIVAFGLKPLAAPFRREEVVPRLRPPSWTSMVQGEYRARLEEHLEVPAPHPQTEREMHYSLLSRPTQSIFAGYMEAVAAGAGVELRLPFFDVRLVELCLSLPPEQKLRRGWSRFVMRNAMAGILPEKIRQRRRKSDLGDGFRHAVRSFGGADMENVVRSAGGELSRYIDPKYVAEMAPRYMNGSVSRSEKIRFWRVSAFARWLMGKTEQESLAVAPPGPARGKGTVTPLAQEQRR
jgi:asparagine synthase (glutamine-hydrolysing)